MDEGIGAAAVAAVFMVTVAMACVFHATVISQP